MPPSRPPPPPLLPSSIPPLIDLDAPISSPPSLASSSSNTPHPTPSTRPTSHRPSPRSIARFEDQPQTPPPPPRHHLDESDIDRFASLFMPATPPGTPTQTSHEQAKIKPCQHRRKHTESSSSDSDFGPFVSVPPSQDPLASSGSATPTMASTTQAPVTSLVVGPTKTGNTSLDYFGQFTTSARAASERSRKDVLDELLEHQDDPMYFLAMQAQVDHPLSEQSSHAPTVTDLLDEDAELRAQTLSPPLPPSTSSLAPTSATHTPRQRSPVPFQSSPPLHPPDMPDFHHESIAEALASELDISPQSHTSTHIHHTHPRPSSQHHTHHTHTSKHTCLNPYEKPTDVPPVRKKLSVSSLTGLPRTGAPLPPHLSATATPPSLSSPSASEVSLPLAIVQEQEDNKPQGHHGGREKGKEHAHQPTWPPAHHGTLSRLSSTLVSAFLSGTPRHSRSTTLSSSTSSTPGITSSSLPSHSSNFLHSSDSSGMPSSSAFAPSSLITHGSPFASTLFIPPTGAPGFTGDRNWDKGFSDTLSRERERGTVDVVGLGGEFAFDGGRAGYVDGPGIANGADPVPVPGAGGMSKNTNTKSARDGPAGGTKMKVKRKGVNLCGRREGTAEVLTEELANEIRPHLPALVRLTRTWTLLYSLDQHGISLNTLCARCQPRIPSASEPSPPKGAIVVVKDSLDGVFGAWVGEGIERGRGGYYGTGEAFLWRHRPDASSPLEVYNWTGKNDYVVLCEPEFISFGGGDGHYGLYIEASLLDGSSAPCPTFDNPALCARPSSQSASATGTKDVSFECVGLEVWGVGPA